MPKYQETATVRPE